MKRTEHLSFLDGIRGLAILLVFLVHCAGAVGNYCLHHQINLDFHPVTKRLLFPAQNGWIGVPIFFVLSGFCIHLSHEGSRKKSLKVFYVRRFFRLYPLYFITLGIFTVFHYLQIRYGNHVLDEKNSPAAIVQILAYVFMLQNFIDLHWNVNGPFWSLAVETQLYLIYPLLLWLASRLGWTRALGITILSELGLRISVILFSLHDPSVKFSTLYIQSPFIYWFSWSVGAFLADAYIHQKPLPFQNSFFILLYTLFPVCFYFAPLAPLCFPLAALATAYLISHFLNRRKGFWSGSLGHWAGYHLRWAGLVSYSAYVVHIHVVNQVPWIVSFCFRGYVFPPLLIFFFCVCSWVPVFGLSYLLYRYIELPSIDWGKRVIATRFSTTA